VSARQESAPARAQGTLNRSGYLGGPGLSRFLGADLNRPSDLGMLASGMERGLTESHERLTELLASD